MFSRLAGLSTGFDKIFYLSLGYIESLQGTFMGLAMSVGKVCFALSLGIGAVKMAFGLEDLRGFFAKYFIMIATFFVMLNIFPAMMQKIFSVTSSMSYTAVLSQPAAFDRSGYNYTGENMLEDFKEWLKNMKFKEVFAAELHKTKKGLGFKSIWDNKKWGSDEDAALDNYLNMKVTNFEYGVMSIDKLMMSMFTMGQVILFHIKGMIEKSDVGILLFFTDFAVMAGTFFAVFVGTIIAIMEYFVCLVYFLFLYGVAVIFIPFMLWESTRFAYESIITNIFQITIRMLVTGIGIYIMLFVQREAMFYMFMVEHLGQGATGSSFEYYLMIIVSQFLCGYLLSQAANIAEFLCGSKLEGSFRDVVAAARSTMGSYAAGAGVSALGAKALVGGAAALGVGGAANIAGGIQAGVVSAQMESGGGGKKFGAFMRGMGTNLATSSVRTLYDVGESLKEGMKKTGSGVLRNAIGAGLMGESVDNPFKGGMYGFLGKQKEGGSEKFYASGNVFDHFRGMSLDRWNQRLAGKSVLEANGRALKNFVGNQVNFGGGAYVTQSAANDVRSTKDLVSKKGEEGEKGKESGGGE